MNAPQEQGIFLCLPEFRGAYPDQIREGDDRNLKILELLREFGKVLTRASEPITRIVRKSGKFPKVTAKVDEVVSDKSDPLVEPPLLAFKPCDGVMDLPAATIMDPPTESDEPAFLAPLRCCRALVAYILTPDWDQMAEVLHAAVLLKLPTLVVYLSPRTYVGKKDGAGNLVMSGTFEPVMRNGKPVLKADGQPALVEVPVKIAVDAIAPPHIRVLQQCPHARIRPFHDLTALREHFQDFFGSLPTVQCA